MAILTVAELKASREATVAKIAPVSDADATLAITEAEALLYSILGYKVATTATTSTVVARGEELLYMPQRVRSVSSVTEEGTAVSSDLYRVTAGGFALKSGYGWGLATDIVVTGTFGYASTDDQYVLAKKFVRVAAVRYLQGTKSVGGFAPPGGGLLTNLTTEGASFDFFTPTGETTGYADLDSLVEQIGKHPFKNRKGIRSVQLRGSSYKPLVNEL